MAGPIQILYNLYKWVRDLDGGGKYLLNEQGRQDLLAGGAFYHLDGTGDKLNVSDDADLDVTTFDFSIVQRFSLTSVGTANQFQVHKESGGIGYGIEVREDDLHIRLDDNTADASAIIGTAVFAADTEGTVVVTFDRDGNATAFVNGINVGTVDISGSALTLANAGDYVLGDDVAGSKVMTGQISLNQLWNRLLTETEVKAITNGAPVDFADSAANQTEQTSGTLTIGQRYRLNDFITGDDFANIGATNEDGNEWIATGTTPTTWSNNSKVVPIGVVGNFLPQNITDPTWFDSSGNDNDLTVTNATAHNYHETIQLERGMSFVGATGENDILIPDNLADAYNILEAANSYIKLITTNGSEQIELAKDTTVHDNFVLEGLTTGRNVMRCVELTIENATEAGKIKMSTLSVFNGDVNTVEDNLAIDVAGTNFQYGDGSGGDDHICMILNAGISGEPIGGFTIMARNETTVEVDIRTTVSGGNLLLAFFAQDDGATDSDLDVMVDTGDIRVYIIYWTNA